MPRKGKGGKRRFRRKKQLSFKKPLMAPKHFCKLRYQTNVSINPGAAGTAAVHTFRANGLYDPDLTGVGHQPRGFDQIMSLYDHYVVLGSKISVTFANTNASVYNKLVGITLQDDGTTSTDVNDYMERSYVSSGMLSATGSQHVITRSLNCSVKRFLGRSSVLSDPQLKGGASSNPTEEAIFHVFGATMQSVDGQVIDCSVIIDYLVAFIEPRDVSQS